MRPVDSRRMLSFPAGRVAAVFTAALAICVIGSLWALWPRDVPAPQSPLPSGGTDLARVTGITTGGCENWGGPGCKVVRIRLQDGQFAGRSSTVTMTGGHGSPPIHEGDRINVARNIPSGIDPALVARLPIDDPSQTPFAFIDFDRRGPLLVLVGAFLAIVAVLGGSHGLRALAGLALSLALVIKFLVPAILAGRPPLLVALTGSLAVMIVTVVIAHGTGVKSIAAILGTAAALLLTALLALTTVHAANITGYSSEEAELLVTNSSSLSLEGLVIAGMVVGALGVLDDVTISQASTVMALKRANPSLRFRKLFKEALSVGRDHLGATVNTLVLAYAGAALPVLLIFATNATPFAEAVNREPVAEQITAMLVGSIGLIAAVPLTTVVAALLASGLPAAALADEHGHHH